MTPYICEGTIVKTSTGREGKVISVDRKIKIAVIGPNRPSARVAFTELLKNLEVVSYREVE